MKERFRCKSPMRVAWDGDAPYIDVRCRRCEACLLVRQWSWIVRAAREQVMAHTTWFTTFTYNRVARARVFAGASQLDPKLAPEARLVRASGAAVTAYWKSLRKAGFEFRYVCVPELHRDGFPHWHGLVHSQSDDLEWRDLNHSWTSGFSVVKRVADIKAIKYVTKYLAKDRVGRVRSSRAYGADAWQPGGARHTVQSTVAPNQDYCNQDYENSYNDLVKIDAQYTGEIGLIT